MKSDDYKMLLFFKKRNKYVLEANMICDALNGLKDLRAIVFDSYIRKCDNELFDEDFELYCKQLDILDKDILNFEILKSNLPHNNFMIIQQPITAPQPIKD
jgi:hypothetical protein